MSTSLTSGEGDTVLQPCSRSPSLPSSWGSQDPSSMKSVAPHIPPTLRVTLPPRVHKFPNLGLSLTSGSFSSRRSDGPNQRFPQALDLPRVDLVPSHTDSLYPKVCEPLQPAPGPETPPSPRAENDCCAVLKCSGTSLAP